MSDVTMAPSQDEIAESLLGDEGAEATESLEQQSTGTEDAVEAQPEESAEPQLEAEPQEEADDWLPSEQEKVFPDDVLLKYAARYNRDEQWLSDPLNRQLIVDKINTDIYLRQQQSLEETEQVAEQFEPEPEPTQPAVQPPSQQEYFANLERAIQQRTDPEVAKAFHADFLRAFGVPEAEIAKAPPQQAQQFAQVASKYMLNLVNTFMGDMLQSQLQTQLDQRYPGFGEMYERSAYAMAWDKVRNSSTEYAALPAYGSKEFSQTLRNAAARIPGFDEMVFTGRDGQPLSPMDNAVRKYSMLAQIASGKNVDPQVMRQAVATGQRQARRAQVTRTAGNLGSGQSTTARSVTSQLADDDPLKEGYEIYKTQHGSL